VNDGALRQVEIELHGVNQKVIRGGLQLPNCLLHCLLGRLIDVDLINARGVHCGYRPGNRMFANALGQYFPSVSRQQLRIAQTADAIARIKYYGGSHDGAEKRPAPDFIDTRDEPRSRGPRELFILQRAAQAL